MTEAQTEAFKNLAYRLEPENISCDGELSRNQIRNRYADIRTEWRKLEREVGRKVSESEVWEIIMKEYA